MATVSTAMPTKLVNTSEDTWKGRVPIVPVAYLQKSKDQEQLCHSEIL